METPQPPPTNEQPSTPPPALAPTAAPAETGLTSDHKMWAMLAHLGLFTNVVVPFGGLLAPILVWQIKGRENAFIEMHGKEATNFAITKAVIGVPVYLFVFLVSFIPFAVCIVVPVFLLLGLVALVFVIWWQVLAAIAANAGNEFRYLVCIRFIK